MDMMTATKIGLHMRHTLKRVRGLICNDWLADAERLFARAPLPIMVRGAVGISVRIATLSTTADVADAADAPCY